MRYEGSRHLILAVLSDGSPRSCRKLRTMSNDLRHQTIATYTMNADEVNHILEDAIQALLRMIELPYPSQAN